MRPLILFAAPHAIPEERRRSTFVYIDEAHEYFDNTIDEMLNQARKFRVGMVLAHQNLDQLSERLRATIMASTSIKFAGGVSARDASAFAREMRCEPDFVQGMRKQTGTAQFACWVKKHHTIRDQAQRAARGRE